MHLRAGDLVQVRPEAEILASLDDRARLDGLPFMPEMVPFCGQKLRVFRRADKTCDSIWHPELRRLDATVLLADVRCDGAAHGGCQAGCLAFWKEAWLRPADDGAVRAADAETVTAIDSEAAGPASRAAATELLERSKAAAAADGTPATGTYSCQATEIRAATAPMAALDLRQYVRDVRARNVGPAHAIGTAARRAIEKLRSRAAGRPAVAGSGDGRARGDLALQPGERVRVRSRDEIVATLDADGRNRGLAFMPEMWRHCGHELTVLRRLDRIIDPRTGKMSALSDVIVLDGVVCDPDYHRFCPRAVYTYWREAWLERIPG